MNIIKWGLHSTEVLMKLFRRPQLMIHK